MKKPRFPSETKFRTKIKFHREKPQFHRKDNVTEKPTISPMKKPVLSETKFHRTANFKDKNKFLTTTINFNDKNKDPKNLSETPWRGQKFIRHYEN